MSDGTRIPTCTRTHPRARINVRAHVHILMHTRTHASQPDMRARVSPRAVGNRPTPSHRRSPALSQTVRGTTASRQSKIVHNDGLRLYVRAHRCGPIPRVSKQPALSHRRSPTVSQTVRGRRHTPATVSRQSKIGRVDHRHHFRASLPTPAPHLHGAPAIFRLEDRLRTCHRRLHGCHPIFGRLSSPHACPTIYFYAALVEAEEFEGAPPPPPVIARIADGLGDCMIGAVSLRSS